MKRYTHIFFDLGLTLVYRDREGRYKEVLKDFGIDINKEQLSKAFHLADKTFFRQYPGVLGKPPEYYLAWYYGIVNFYLGISLNLNSVSESIMSYKKDFSWKPFPYTIDTLTKLKQMGYVTGLISNWDKSCRQCLEKTGISGLLDYKIISSEVGADKPDEKIFKQAFWVSGAVPERSLFVGDNYYDDVIGCQKVGMDCLLINPYGNLGIEETGYKNICRNISEIPEILGERSEKYVC